MGRPLPEPVKNVPNRTISEYAGSSVPIELGTNERGTNAAVCVSARQSGEGVEVFSKVTPKPGTKR